MDHKDSKEIVDLKVYREIKDLKESADFKVWLEKMPIPKKSLLVL